MNPRYPFGVYTISNRARSASYATSPCCDRYCSQLEYITLFDSICQYLFSVFSQFIFIPDLSAICCRLTANCGTEKLLTEYQKMDIITEPKYISASVAQSVVHLTRNEKVACSSQVTSSKNPGSFDPGFFVTYPIPIPQGNGQSP